jgi:hypothetical protein
VSWDIALMNLPDVPTITDVPEEFEFVPLGTREEVIAKIRDVVPEADFSDPSWGVITGADYSVEVNVGREAGQVDGVMLLLRGADGAFDVVARLLERLPWRGWDIQTGELYSPGPARESFDRWRRWRDRVIGEVGSQ